MFILTRSGCFCIMCVPLGKTQEGRVSYRLHEISLEWGDLYSKTSFVSFLNFEIKSLFNTDIFFNI